MTKQAAAEAWAGYVGSQTPAEFMAISKDKGFATAEEAVADYVLSMASEWPETDTTHLHGLLVEYINADIHCTVGRTWDAETKALDWHQFYPVVNAEGVIVAVVPADGSADAEYDYDESAEVYRVRQGA